MFRRCRFKTPAEDTCHMRLAGRPTLCGNVDQACVLWPETLLGLAEPKFIHVLMRGQSSSCAEHAQEMSTTVAALLRQAI